MAAIGEKNGKWEHLPYSMHYRRVGDRLSPGKVENDLQRASTEHQEATGISCYGLLMLSFFFLWCFPVFFHADITER